MKTIAERLNYVRKQKGFTYKQLGNIIGITGDAVRISINRNNVKDYYLNLFSEKLEIDRTWLLTGKGDWQGKNNVIIDIEHITEVNSNQSVVLKAMRELIRALEDENEALRQQVLNQKTPIN